MEILMNFLQMAVFALIGLLIYSLWKVRDKIMVFNLKKFVSENKAFWLWAVLLQFTFALLLAIEPNAAEAIKTIIGLDYSETMSFISTGALLGAAANGVTKNPIGKKPE